MLFYTPVTTVNLDAITNGATTPAGGLIVGVNLAGFLVSDIIRVSLPIGGVYVAWSPWGIPTPGVAHVSGSVNKFNVVPNSLVANVITLGNVNANNPVSGYEAARAAFIASTFTGYTNYTFYIPDSILPDNTGGLSVFVERGVESAVGPSTNSIPQPVQIGCTNSCIPFAYKVTLKG